MMDAEKISKLVKKVGKAKRDMAVVANMIGQLNSRIAELQEEIASGKEAHEKLLGQLKARFAAIEKK